MQKKKKLTSPGCNIWYLLLVLLSIVAGLGTAVAKAPKCVPQDWTSISNYLEFGTCNWPSQQSPCGPAVPVAQQPPGQRAWPQATCTLKFSRTPWAPEIFPQERDSGWVCGTMWQRCTQTKRPHVSTGTVLLGGDTNSTMKPNGTAQVQSPINCGGKVAGTDQPCPSDADGWVCEPEFKVFSNSNCKSNGEDLVLDVSSMGYPSAIANSRVSTPQQCQEMCMLRTGCNTWNYCNSTQGCGWSCQDYLNKLPDHVKKSSKSFWKGTGLWIIIVVVCAVVILAIIIVTLCVCRRYRYKARIGSNVPITDPLTGITITTSDAHSVAKSVNSPVTGMTTLGHPAGPVLPANAQLPPSYPAGLMQHQPHSSQVVVTQSPDAMPVWNGPLLTHTSGGMSAAVPASLHSHSSSLTMEHSVGGFREGPGVNVVMGQVPHGAPVLPSTGGPLQAAATSAGGAPHPRRFQFTGGSDEESRGGPDGSSLNNTGANPSSGRSHRSSGSAGRQSGRAEYNGANHIVLGTS